MLAAGAGAFGPNRPPLAGLAAYEATGAVRYACRRREDFRGRHVVIAGGGDSRGRLGAVAKDIAAKVYVVHRRPKFRAAPETAAPTGRGRRARGGRDGHPLPAPRPARRARRAGGRRGRRPSAAAAPACCDADRLLPFFGLSMDLGPIAAWGLDQAHGHVQVTPATCETSMPGVFAIGDVATYPGKLKLILQGFSEACDGRPRHPPHRASRHRLALRGPRRPRACRTPPLPPPPPGACQRPEPLLQRRLQPQRGHACPAC